MDNVDKTRRIFLVGTIVLGGLIVMGLIWAVAMGSGKNSGNIDPNIIFNDDGNPSVGLVDTKVTVRIYSDFQCPACKTAEAVLRQVIKDYEGKVKFVWNDLPLASLHANAQSAALAGRCAQEQARFWEYAAQLYDTQGEWERLSAPGEFFIRLADGLGLGKDHFTTCLSQDAPRMRVAQDVQEASAMGLESTPTFFVNRQKYEGVLNSDAWHKILDAALK